MIFENEVHFTNVSQLTKREFLNCAYAQNMSDLSLNGFKLTSGQSLIFLPGAQKFTKD